MTSRLSFLKKPIAVLSILLVIAVAGCVYYYIQYQKVAKTPDQVAKEKTQQIVKEISNLMVVPSDPNALVATITDKSKLAGQSFFDLAKNGDDLILFPSIKKAVLYRPSLHKIIDVGPFNPNAATSTAPTAKTVSKTESTSTKSR